VISGLAAYRVHDQELTVERIALARAIDVHASLVQDRLTERELLARVASGLFRAPSVIKANMLEPLRSSIYAFKTDFVVAGWIARLKPGELEAARTELAGAGFPNPTIRSFDDAPLATSSLDHPIDVLMDVEPRNAETMALAGRALDRCWNRRWPAESRWRPILWRCCTRTGRSASFSRRRCCRTVPAQPWSAL
jgi:hypothetical protein